MVYCHYCGTEITGKNQYCHSCGGKLHKSIKKQEKVSKVTNDASQENVSKETNNVSKEKVNKEKNEGKKSFQEFLKERNKNRGKHKMAKKQHHEDTEIMIHVSMLRLVNGGYRQISGSRTPVAVKVDADYDKVKKAAFDKLKRYVPETIDYEYPDLQLCFRSGESALCLPGTLTDFTLKLYKDNLGVKYNQIVLHLKPFERENGEISLSRSDDESNLPEVPKVAWSYLIFFIIYNIYSNLFMRISIFLLQCQN